MKTMRCSRREWLAAGGAACLATAGASWPFGQGRRNAARAAEAGTPRPTRADAWPLFRGTPSCDGVASGDMPDVPAVVWKRTFKDSSFEATATIVESMIYVGALDGGDFYAIDLAGGEVKWSHPTELGFKAAAAVRDGVVYVGDTDGKFFAFDAATGDVKWSVDAGNEINAGANFYRDKLLFTCEDGSLNCLELADGKKVWRYSIDSPLRCAPCVVGDHAFLGGCDGRLHVVNLADGSAFAQINIQDPTLSTPAAVGERVYFGTQGARFLGVHWREKRIDWTYEPKGSAQQVKSSAAVAEGLVVFGGKDKLIHALAADTGNEVWSASVRAPIDSSPVVAGGRVFIGTGRGQLVAVDLKTGALGWQYEAGGRFEASPAVAQGKLVIGNDAGELYCFGEKR